MTKTIVLILMINGGGGRPAISTQEFSSEENCEAAGANAVAAWKEVRYGQAVYVCSYK